MSIKKDIDDNYFFTSHINNVVLDETKPYSLFGYDNARIFKDISTDSFINNIFDEKEKLFKFVDYTFYSIYAKIPKIHNIMYLNGYFLDSEEYVDIIFKGGNTMSFFFDIIINSMSIKYSEIFDYKLNKIHDYLKKHNVDLNINDDDSDMFYLNSNNTIKDFFDDNKKKFKISDVDYTMYINIDEPIKYNIASQLYNKILINSLIEIRNFFDAYYNNVINSNNDNYMTEIITNEYLPFKSNDDPSNTFILLIKESIKKIKLFNSQNFYDINNTNYINNENNDNLNIVINGFLYLFFGSEVRIVDILLTAHDKKNYFNRKNIHYKNITNLRLMTAIFEYLELLKIYFEINNSKKLIYVVKDFIIIVKDIINHHLNNKKRKILDSKMYNSEVVNNFINEIASKYNKENNPSLYNTKYLTAFDKKENIDKIKLDRKNPNTDLFFNSSNFDDDNNEISVVQKNDSLTYSTNDISLYYTNNSYEQSHYHYISYNNSISNSYKLYDRKFELFRIKFNVQLIKPIIKINNIIKEKYDIPSEFVDVSIPAFTDINRKCFYKEVQEEGINILNYSQGSNDYYWNTYSIHQLFDDLLKILFGPTIVPWYDAKYDKRITRLLLLFSFYKVEKNIKYNESCNWICFLTDMLKLTNELYIFSTKSNINTVTSLEIIKPFILGKSFEKKYSDTESNIILTHIFDNLYYKLDELGYNYTIKIDDYYKDFELIIRFIIFYSHSMKKSCFFDVFNQIRYISGLLPYKPNKKITKNGEIYDIIDYNNLKFKELLKLIVNTISVIIFVLNETNNHCELKDLNICNVPKQNEKCEQVLPINYNFNSNIYKYLDSVVENDAIYKNVKQKKYFIKNVKNLNNK